MSKYFLSFVGYGIMNPKYDGYVAGRIEVHDDQAEDTYAKEEIPYFTKSDDWVDFCDKWDFMTITAEELAEIKKIVKEKYYETT